MLPAIAQGQLQDTILIEQNVKEVTVKAQGGTRRMSGAQNGLQVGQKELFRMACCNLGESFATNPSVDVQYSDAATGARQIKLLGLSGTYVQMLTENLPNFRATASPYALGYVPGTWMKAINISKGAASVKNGYESITGQIDIDYLKPDDPQALNVNIYGDSQTRMEGNFDVNFHPTSKLSGSVLGHYENRISSHDANDDGFQDMPSVEQYNASTRWKLVTDRYIMHSGMSILAESRESGQHGDHFVADPGADAYRIDIGTNRLEAYTKHAIVLNPERQESVALMGNLSLHNQEATFGKRIYNVDQTSLYAQLMYEAKYADRHQISAGISLQHDSFDEDLNDPPLNILISLPETENVQGMYAQYTYTQGTTLTAMAGLRIDHSSIWGGFFTPRFHLKYQPNNIVSIRLSAGKGYRTARPLAENSNLLASNRDFIIEYLGQEEAWNLGASTAWYLSIAEKTLKLNLDYYYTNFIDQVYVDFDTDAHKIIFTGDGKKSYSHVMQVDATYPLFKRFTLTAAYRYNDVRSTYNNELRTKPLTPKYKAMATASYQTRLDRWQFDLTAQFIGGGRLPDPYVVTEKTVNSWTDGNGKMWSWNPEYKAYCQLSAQVTKRFKRMEVYIGGENLTNHRQKNPIISAHNPWSRDFDPTMIYAPMDGAMVYVGARIKVWKGI